ncbi:MAG TPA: hypothetical protein VFN35_25880 [Ktedonobacteraceae bacterium]|nr:hypothetical protein [Ktedonobacteraceae bacterium]
MTQGQREPKSFHCPRCGGPMRKLSGSTLYWHADNNHPRCDITNILEAVLDVQQPAETTEPPPEPPKKRRR